MKGVTLALQLAFEVPVGDPDAEHLHFTDGTSAHLFESYAMANMLLCSAVARAGGQAGRSTAAMHKNCANHLVHGVDRPNQINDTRISTWSA